MRITEVSELTKLSADQIRYMEKKGYIQPSRVVVTSREIREYSPEDISLLELISKYLSLGFRYDIAYGKALDDKANPRLI